MEKFWGALMVALSKEPIHIDDACTVVTMVMHALDCAREAEG